MSYILEALKKAQAERQLGSAPSIHAPPSAPVAGGDGGAARRSMPWRIAGGIGVLAVVGGAALWWPQWRHRAPADLAQTTAVPSAPGPGAVLAAAPVTTPASAPVPASASVPVAPAPAATLAVSAPDVPTPAPHAAAPRPGTARGTTGQTATDVRARADAPVAHTGTVSGSVPYAQPAMASAGAPSAPATAARPPPAPAPVAATASEDSLPMQQQLPESVQSQIPRVSFGGYMYSANAADRLLLVDKALRHEGEEVAPGLVLEKLMPRAAVMNFRGVRYRVGL